MNYFIALIGFCSDFEKLGGLINCAHRLPLIPLKRSISAVNPKGNTIHSHEQAVPKPQPYSPPKPRQPAAPKSQFVPQGKKAK